MSVNISVYINNIKVPKLFIAHSLYIQDLSILTTVHKNKIFLHNKRIGIKKRYINLIESLLRDIYKGTNYKIYEKMNENDIVNIINIVEFFNILVLEESIKKYYATKIIPKMTDIDLKNTLNSEIDSEYIYKFNEILL